MQDSWYKHLKDAVYLALCAAFKVDPESSESLAHFIPAYEEDITTPQVKRTKTVCYYAISEIQGTEYDYINVVQKKVNGVPSSEITDPIPVNVLLTFYGPDADGEAERFWKLYQWDNGVGSPRSILRKLNIVPSGQPQRPIGLNENEGTYMRRRCDVSFNLLYTHVETFESTYIIELPEIKPVLLYST